MDAQTLGALADIVKDAIAQAVAPLHDRIKELEGRPIPQNGKDGRDGVDGKDGAPGEKGLDGKDGRDGVDGKDGLPGEKGLDGKNAEPASYDDSGLRTWIADQLKALPAPVAIDGVDGKDGAPGADGRDALQLEILPAIDEQKSYPRGSYAKHAGGLWRSFEQTHGLRGWECIVDGIAWVSPTIDGKHIKMTVRTSSGHEDYADAVIPVQVYKGVFDASDYEQGDTATWAGSLWHCNMTGTKAKPGDGSPDWTLAVKKGRDGREVVSVPKGAHQPVQIGGANG